jgi:hypothetical protein
MRYRLARAAAGFAIAVALLLTAGCGSQTEAVPIPEESVAEALRSKLETDGLDVAWLTTSQRPDFFDSRVRRATLQIDGDAGTPVNLYRFPDEQKAAAGAGGVSEDGMQVPMDGGLASVSWTGRPHFFRRGRLIALFCESGDVQPVTRRDRVILAALQEVMGPQFAGLSHE